MVRQNVLITGVNGEVGHVLVGELAKKDKYRIIALYRNNLDKSLLPSTDKIIQGDVLDYSLLEKIIKKNNIDIIFHLAAMLSTSGEKNPGLAQKINVEGTVNLLEIATKESILRKKPIKFIFPSTIAVYGIPTLKIKNKAGKISEEKFNDPITMYGCNKIYCEKLGKYYSRNYMLLSEINRDNLLDFRCVRFPGLISATTLPTGGTSDFASEMVHAAAQGKKYECFVRKDSAIPFLAMPDAINALINLSDAPRKKLTRLIYNVVGFAPTAKEIQREVNIFFPKAKINYLVDKKRQKIVDSWPSDLDDSYAKADWGWKAKYNFRKTFEDYLTPAVIEKYKSKKL